MELASTRDWVIIILGILNIILMIGLLIVLVILYSKINQLINKGKETVRKIERAVASPYLKAGSWVFQIIATGLGIFQKKHAKEG